MHGLERGFQRLGHLGLWIGPRQIADMEVGERSERLVELLVVEAGRAGRDDAHRLETLAHHVAHELDRIGGARHDQDEIGLMRRILVTSTERSCAFGS